MVVGWELTSALNFTVIDFEEITGVPSGLELGLYDLALSRMEMNSAHGVIREADTDGLMNVGGINGFHWIWVISFKDYLLMYGPEGKSPCPTSFSSILGPFQWFIWLLILAMSGLASVPAILARKGHLDVAATILSVWAPLLAQTPDHGIDRKMLLSHSSWVLLTLYINSCCLGTLSSIAVVPEIRVRNVSFRSLLEQNFTFSAGHYTAFELDNGFGNHTGIESLFSSTMHVPADDEKDYVLLRSIMKEKKDNDWKSPEEVRDFFKLEKKVWMGERKDVVTIASVGRDLLGHNYEILTRKRLLAPIYTQIDAIQVYELGRGYSFLVEAGVVNFWQDFGTSAIKGEKAYTFHKYMGVEGSARARDQFEPVGLRDSLTLEELCLLVLALSWS